MRKILIIGSLLLTTTLPVLAQNTAASLNQPNRFCVVRSSATIDDSRPGFTLDSGVMPNANKKAGDQADVERFKAARLHSVADMLNYMDGNG